MLNLLKNKKVKKGIAVYFLLSFLFQIFFPTAAMALTSGPGQEEFASFEPASTTDMVDMYSGDYNYNIPLLSVPGPNGGYPINIAYHSGIGMEQEASWVGLGWTLNVGAINRNLRGLPDDFNGDLVKKTQHVKDNVTASVDIPIHSYTETVGVPPDGSVHTSSSLQLYYNSYKGLGARYTFSATRACETSSQGLAISFDSQNGMGIGLSFSAQTAFGSSGFLGGFGLAGNYNSRQGLQSANFSTTVSYQASKTFGKSTKTHEERHDNPDFITGGNFGGGGNSMLSFGTVFGVPKTTMAMKTTTIPFTLKIEESDPLFIFRSAMPLDGSVTVSKTSAKNGEEKIPAQGYINTSGQTTDLKDFSRQDIMYSKKIPHLAPSSFTYDLFMQTGQGTGSMFRPYLNTFGVLSDPQKVSTDRVAGGGVEIGAGGSGALSLHIGVDFEYGAGKNSSGPWTQIGSDPDWDASFTKLMAWQPSNTKLDYEHSYFQVIGEKTGYHLDEDELNDFQGDQAVRVDLKRDDYDNSFLNRHFIAKSNVLHDEGLTTTALDGTNQTRQRSGHKRIKRATSIETLTDAEAEQYGFSKGTTYLDGTLITPVDKPKDFSRPGNHISEISMLQSDGMRYVYGLPTYNNKQVDNVFAVNEDAAMVPNYPDAAILPGSTGGIDVSGTTDEYVSKNELPAYANSWLLTAVYSADYLDVTGNGPTDDDFGYWVKFNYKKVANSYKWRVPFYGANYMDGTKNNSKDNKGSYTYGEKDLYVLTSIETKTHIAVFETSKRKDGFEASGEYSTGSPMRGPQTMQKLDKIKLYTKKEYAETTPVPTKVINFEYNYELCANVPNNAGTGTCVDVDGNTVTCGGPDDINYRKGKLTLKKLFFTYQTSSRGKMSPYVFSYGTATDQQDNPDYNKNAMDRWGNYKNPAAYAYIPSGGSTPVTTYPYLEHPYTEQDTTYYDASTTGLKAAPWTLKQISLPTGGTLSMEYEPDDYAYVEKNQAQQMFDICYMEGTGAAAAYTGAMGTNASRTNTAQKIQTEQGGSAGGNKRIYFRLNKTLEQTQRDMGMPVIVSATTSAGAALFNKLYLDNVGQFVYFNIYSNLSEQSAAAPIHDYVKGYAEIESGTGGIVSNGLTGAAKVQYGYFNLKNKPLAAPINITGINVSPFTLASLQHLRAYRSDIIFPPYATGSSSVAAQVCSMFAAIPGMMTDIMSTVMGFNNYAYAKKWGREIQLNGYSTIRLCNPCYKKTGGGVRVKKITLNDNWQNGVATLNSLYGQEYDYTTTQTINGQEATISSGVAYEPLVGGDESALRSPVNYTNSIPLYGVYSLFMENPILESYYPGAGVGYSKITVKSIAPDQAAAESTSGGSPPTNTLKYTAAPITVHEFYTPKDFPVVFDETDMNPGQPIRVPIMIPGVLTDFKTRQAKSQGYSIILNDMAGKPKAITTKTKNTDQIISLQKYIYNTESAYNEDAVNKLSSKVQTLEIDKSTYQPKYITSVVGQTDDMFIDMNEDAQKMESFGLDINFDLYFDPEAELLFCIVPLPTIKADESNMRTVVFNKVINRTGILKKVETTTNESTITTENLAFDIETGEPLLTKVTNEFKDPVYNFNYPGHWYYPNMAGAYKNFGLKIDPPGSTAITSDASGYLDLSAYLPSGTAAVSDFFAKGDQVFVDLGTSSGFYNVLNVYDPNKILLIGTYGDLLPPSTNVYSLKVTRSGFKNMQSAKVGSLTFEQMHATNSADLFTDYDPGNDAGTKKTLLTPFEIESAADNKIINASAIEYSNDWQVFCGTNVPADTNCSCELGPDAYDLLNMLENLKASGSLFTTDVQLYDMVNDVYSNGFTRELLVSNPKLVAEKATALAGGVAADEFYYYRPYFSGNDLYMLIHNNPTGALTLDDFKKTFCVVKLDFPSGTNAYDVDAFTAIATTGGCDSGALGINITAVKADGSTITIPVTVESTSCSGAIDCPDCWAFGVCNTQIIPDYACGIPIGEPINPYKAGMKGLWRPKASYAYHTSRTQADNVRTDGVFSDYVRFPWEDPNTANAKWVKASTVTKYSPHGFELENEDALGNYSSALYGYKQSLVTAVGSNAKYNELGYDNFEDYPLECTDKHFRFENYQGNVSNTFAHTGKYSMKVLANSSVDEESDIYSSCPFQPIDDATNPYTYTDVDPHHGNPIAHLVASCDCLGGFAPEKSKKYVASVWVKEVSSAGVYTIGATAFTAPELKITISVSSGSPVVATLTPQGNVIDGWQQIFGSFDIPSNATGITVEMVNTAVSGKTVYFDDIRLHPFDANMVSYVYDPITLKTMAELDANNFATFYIYDDEGHLNKVKKETAEGIKTIKEGRINTKKYNE